MRMSQVTELGYFGISVSNGDAWKSYCSEIIGLQVVDEGEKDRFYLRADDWHHRFVVHLDGADDYAYAGWRVAGRPELESVERKLDAAGIAYRESDRAEAEERRVLGLIKLQDPSGNPLEIFYGPQVDRHKPFHPGRPMFGRIITSAKGLGHCILRQSDIREAVKFYSRLGFVGDVEYQMEVSPGHTIEPVFMHLNARQHSLAFGVEIPGKRLNHIMLEYGDLRDLGLAQDLALARQTKMPMSLGMHANDEMLSFYITNPSGWMFELGWGGRDAPTQQEYYRSDVFGHFRRET
jgi:2,3-dihydroxyethylbenzene 1,2-dioxygenase